MNSTICVWLSGPFFGSLACIVFTLSGMNIKMAKTLGLCIFMIFWWLCGPVKMGITGLLPMIFLPLLGVSSGVTISKEYFNDSVVICWGTLLIATVVEKYDLQKIFATKLLNITEKFGLNGILFGFVFITGFLSMWLSNTATAALMIPLSKAVFSKLKFESKNYHRALSLDMNTHRLDANTAPSVSLSRVQRPAVGRRIVGSMYHSDLTLSLAATSVDLGIAYAAALGGMATLTGTGSNIVLQGTLLSQFGNETPITFLGWLLLFAPLTFVNLILLWIVLMCCFNTCGTNSLISLDSKDVDEDVAVLCDSSMNKLLHRKRTLSNEMQMSTGQTDDGINDEDYGRKNTADQDNCSNASLTFAQWMVLLAFCGMIVLWITRNPPGDWGWSRMLANPQDVTDGTVAMMCCLFLFIVPATSPQFIQSFLNYMNKTSSVQRGGGTYSLAVPSMDISTADKTENYLHFHGGDNKRNKQRDSSINSFTVINSEEEGDDATVRDNIMGIEMSIFTTTGTTASEMKCHTEDTSQTYSTHNSNTNNEDDKNSNKQHNELVKSKSKREYEGVLSWSAVAELNWDVIFLLGGGFALSKGFQESGLSEWLSSLITSGDVTPSISIIILTASLIACGVTNVMSNIATANILLPALTCIGPKQHISPVYVLAPVALATSLAFLFPVGTPPNAIILSNQNVTLSQMFRVGLICTLLFMSTVLIYCVYVVPHVLNVYNVSSSILDTCGET